MMDIPYPTIKRVHIACVVTSYALFVLRGFWMMRGSAQLRRPWVRILPHVIDTILLASATTLAVLSQQYPFLSGWLTAKLAGLLGYIGLGNLALKRGKTRRTRVAAWVAAQILFAYIVLVAITRRPLLF